MDCGVFICMFAESASKGQPIWFTQSGLSLHSYGNVLLNDWCIIILICVALYSHTTTFHHHVPKCSFLRYSGTQAAYHAGTTAVK